MMRDDIKELLLDHEIYHSNFQIDNFIIGGQGNAWAQYKQCLREIKSRYDNLESMKDERKLLELDIKEFSVRKIFYVRRSTRLNQYRRLIKLNSAKRKLADLEESMHHVNRELLRFIGLAKRIKFQTWGKAVITGDLRAGLESQMWMEKVTQMLAIDVLVFGQVSKNTMEILFSMPRKERKELLEMIEPGKRDILIEWVKK